VVGVAGNTRRHFGQQTWYLRPGSSVNGVRGTGVVDHPHLTVLENVRIGLQRKLGTSFHFWKPASSLYA
jgi:hypothetical protein